MTLSSLALALLFVSQQANAVVDLHAHLFIEDSLPGWMYRGDFNEPIRATSWRDQFSSKTNADALDRSDNKIIVVALYAHALASGSLRDNVRTQIKKAREFVKAHPSWIIPMSSEEGAAALKKGKRLLILSLEGMEGILETDEDLKEFVDEGGIRIVTFMHFMDDQFGGAAFMPSFFVLLNPISLFKNLFSSTYSEGVRVNPHGLSDEGREMAKKLMARKVWIDLAHASDDSEKELSAMLQEKKVPFLYTHTMLRETYGAERGISRAQLEKVRASGGVVGVLPSTKMLQNTDIGPDFCGSLCHPPCSVGLASFGRHVRIIRDIIGMDGTMIGTDINSILDGIESGCPEGSSIGQEGFWRLDQLPALYVAVGMNNPRKVVDGFMSAWIRAEKAMTAAK